MPSERDTRKLNDELNLHKFTDEQHLKQTGESDYKGNYGNDLLEQYKLYVELTDRINARIHQANTFFLSINIAAVGAVGYIKINSTSEHHEFATISLFIIAYLAVIACTAWVRSINAYKELNERRLGTINLIEKRLPLNLFYPELKAMVSKRGSKLGILLRTVELVVPGSFMIIHIVSLLFTL